MADLQIGRQRSEGLHYSASRRRLTKGHEKTARKGKKGAAAPRAQVTLAAGPGRSIPLPRRIKRSAPVENSP
ncbi:MAG: hypothetical protein AUH13_20445 [Acidobacteria bacterium 13_2_20CM_58_27]|nr:MAG: hypothetical protein AUH13_20445 [Acidobacteria bacterium 13_2_20CM_58_27]